MKNRKAIRIIAIVLVFLLVGGVIVSSLMAAMAEAPSEAARDQYTISVEYLSDEQALRVSQRLVYINRAEVPLDSVVFYAAGNMFRRESALMYEAEDLETVFYAGYAPGGLDIQSVRFEGEETDWGMQGENEMYLRAACQIAPGESGVFEFDYYLLLTECGAFMGVGDMDVRLSAFYFIPGVWDELYDEYRFQQPVSFTRWLHSEAADYDVTLTIPENYLPAATGTETLLETAGDTCIWHIAAENVREFALSFGRRYRLWEATTESGVQVRLFTNARNVGDILTCAVNAIDQCEAWFGAFPVEQMDIVQSDYPLGALNFPGAAWLSGDLFQSGQSEDMQKRIRFCIAQQYFGLSAYVEPVADAWLSDALCEYISYLILEAEEGHERFLQAINADWVDSLQMTIPGGLTVTSDASLFNAGEYEVVVLDRGAVVMHELRSAMGLETMLEGLRGFYQMGADGHTLTEMELVDAMNAASGGDWEAFLTDWVFNVGDYVDQTIDWFE